MIKIDQALLNTFIEADFDLPIAHENIDFNPDTEAHVELSVMQNDVTGLGLTDTNQTDGIFQAVLRYPVNIGAVTIKQKADEIFTVYKIGATFQYDTVKVKITSNQRFNGINDGGWYKVIISIGYMAFLSR